jgi:hypothetical protein
MTLGKIVSRLLVGILVFVLPGRAANVSLLSHLVSMLQIPPDADARWPKPVQVYRMELDVTGDGKPELFLGTTWEAGRRGLLWVVYSPQPDGTYRPLGVIEFAYTSFYYSASSSTIFVPVSGGPGAGPAFVYYHVGADGISDITETYTSNPGADLASMSAWQAKGRPSVYVDTLADLQSAGAPQWKDADSNAINSSVGKLDALVTETGDCSAEKYLDAFRNAGCVPTPQ